jgi:hypothetical protein
MSSEHGQISVERLTGNWSSTDKDDGAAQPNRESKSSGGGRDLRVDKDRIWKETFSIMCFNFMCWLYPYNVLFAESGAFVYNSSSVLSQTLQLSSALMKCLDGVRSIL